MKKVKILFQGDSITDAGRDRSDPHNLTGYTAVAAERLRAKAPDVEFEFLNLGISGDTTENLFSRFETDVEEVGADIVTLLIGINDVWRRFDRNYYTPPAVFRARYEEILKRIKATGAKLVVLEPYLQPSEVCGHFRADLALITDEVRSVAYDYADAYIPLDGLLAKARIKFKGCLAGDGIHPTAMGHQVIGTYLAEEILGLLS